MYSTKTKNQFIQLRSEGFSLARIADQLRVSKPTLIKWNHEFRDEINLSTALERDSRYEKVLLAHQSDLTRLSKLQDTLENELEARKLAEIPTDKLFRLAQSLRHQIHSAHEHSDLLKKQKPYIPDGLSPLERMRKNLNLVRMFSGEPPLDSSRSEVPLNSIANQTPLPEPVNKQPTSPENP